MMSPSKMYLIFAVSLFAISTANGNYGYDQQRTVCDRGAYDRAQNTIRLEMNSPRGVVQSGQPPYNQPYSGQNSGMTNSYQGNSQQQIDQQCRTIRQSFKDLLINTPLCEQVGGYSFQNTANLLEQARQFMRTHCERNEGPLHSQCFKSFDINQCESQFSSSRSRLAQNPVNTQVNSGYNSQSNYPGGSNYNNQPVTYELCQTFNAFRHCVYNATARQCYGDDQMHQYSYLYDHGRNLAYSCSPSQTPIIGSGYPNQMGGSAGTDYSRRTDLSYPNQNYPNSNYPGSSYPNSNYPNSNYPNSNIPGSGSYSGSYPGSSYPGQNSFSGRNLPTYQQAGNYPLGTHRSFDPSLSTPVVDVCIHRVQPYESACTELLVQRQRDARHGRSSNDVQRRICCAIFYYRDCLSRVVLEHCRESTRTVVDLIMGDRNRELTTNCRDYTREQCSGVTSLQASLLTVALATLLLLFRF